MLSEAPARGHFLLTLAFLLLLSASGLAAPRNVLLLIADDYGVDSSSLYNTTAGAQLPPTPNINALKNSGVMFRNAYAHPTCSPTRATMLTGRHPFRHGVTTAVTASDGQLQSSEFTLPEAFAANPQLGYSVAAFGKWHLTIGPGTADDPNSIGGWPHYAGCLSGAVPSYTNWSKTVNGVTTSNITTYATTDTVNDTLAWVQARGTNRWFAWVGFNAPHNPFHKPPAALHTYNLIGVPINGNEPIHYRAAAQALDTEIGRLFTGIGASVLSNTMVVFIGDNGTPGRVIQPPYTTNHAKDSLYEGGVRVPLLISGPEIVSPNREVATPVHAADLYTTILELAGIDVATTQPASRPLDSRSLLTLLTNGTDNARYGYSADSGSTVPVNEAGQALRNGAGYRLIQFQNGTEELYEVLSDPNEQTNLLLAALSPVATINYALLQAQLATYVNSANPTGSPLESSWFTYAEGAKFARIYRTQADALAGNAVSTWLPSGMVLNGAQTNPAYAGIQSVRVSANWVYITSSGLANHTMGPWYFDEAKTQIFVNWPKKTNVLVRFPRVPVPAVNPDPTTLGAIAYWVDGTIIHNQLDAFVWNGSADVDSPGAVGSWQRNARYAEWLTFDVDGAHQPFTGEHHHHINPKGLRYLLGDHMDYNPATHTYTESTSPPIHSPILGWSFDGYPIYGPYGYGDPNNTNSTVRRMISGYVFRDGSYGTTNLNVTGRTSYPAWALAIGQATTPFGPPVSSSFPLGWYVQDFDHLADRGYLQGVDFDLDRYNGRLCRTPEFPNGTYAYFVTIEADGTPAYPYVIGRQYYGVKAGGNYGATATIGFTGVETPNVTNYLGGTNATWNMQAPTMTNSGARVILTWSSIEGGRYQIETNDTLTSSWGVASNNIPGGALQTQRLLNTSVPARFFRARATAFDQHDPVVVP
jgi:arylsulfatase A-like enzyme